MRVNGPTTRRAFWSGRRIGPWKEIRIGPFLFPTWGALGVMGVVSGSAVYALLTARAGHGVASSGAVVAVGAAAALMLTTVVKAVTGRELWVYWHHVVLVGTTTTLVAALTGQAATGHLARFTVGILLVDAFGRVGCTLAGCCHGRPGSIGLLYDSAALTVPAGVRYRHAVVRLVPVPAMESIAAALIAVAGAWGLLHGMDPTSVAAGLLATYAIVRILLEVWRGETSRPAIGSFTHAQVTALFIGLGGGLVLEATVGLRAAGLVAVGVFLALGVHLLIWGSSTRSHREWAEAVAAPRRV